MSKSTFSLQIVVDFNGDIRASHFTEKTFKEMMLIFKSWGITRVYWNGQSYASGLYDAAYHDTLATNALRTYEEVGEFIPMVVKCAHEQCMELYVEFKPFDMYFPLLAPHGTDLFSVRNTWRKGVPALGGSWQMGSIFPEQHPEYLMARNMTGVRDGIEREPIGSIKFVKNDDMPTGITKENLQIYTSSDNQNYRLYDRPYRYKDTTEDRREVVKGVNLNREGDGTERVRTITLSGLSLTEPYVAVSTRRKNGEPDFANAYYKLVELYTDKGEPMPFTYGIPSRQADMWLYPRVDSLTYGHPGDAAYKWITACFPSSDSSAKLFPERGFQFDIPPQHTTQDLGYRAIDTVGFLDSEFGLLGLAKGKNPYATPLCAAHPEVREYWLGQVKEFIDWGADGVEFRWAAHQNSLEWDAYGFSAPIVEEYKKRYGEDILREDFDRRKWRALRGEYYTKFLREAKDLLASHDRKMMVDVMPQNMLEPDNTMFLNVQLDWQQWFGFADGVSFKWVQPNTEADTLFRELANRCGIPTYYNVWPQVVYDGWSREKIVEHLKSLKAVGHQGFMLYEAAAFMRARPDGSFEIVRTELIDTIALAVKAMNEEGLT